MEATTANHSKKRGKGKANDDATPRTRRVWTTKECDVLIRCMMDKFCDKWKAETGQFRAGFFNEVEKALIMALPGTDLRVNPHIDSKIKHWRKQYNLITDMGRLSGFGWDDQQKMVTVDSDEVWNTYVKVNYSFYYLLLFIFLSFYF